MLEPWGLPLSTALHSPLSRTPALSHRLIRRMIRRSAVLCSNIRTTHSWSSESNEAATHYPPRGLSDLGHRRSSPPPAGRPGAPAAWLDAAPWQARSDSRPARRVSYADPGVLDGPGPLHTTRTGHAVNAGLDNGPAARRPRRCRHRSPELSPAG